MPKLGFIIVCLLSIISVKGQELQRCGSVERLQQKFKGDRHLQLRFEQERSEFNKSIESGYFINRGNAARLEGNIYVIPVVVHIVLPDPAKVTDEAVVKQLEVLNQAFAGTAADSAGIPQYFKEVKGKSI